MASDSLIARLKSTLADSWAARARPDQLPPPGDWSTWLIMSGRGWGKTLTGAQWVTSEIRAGRARRVALISPTAADARDVLVEGESGIMSCSAADFRPDYEPSKRRLTWPNGAVATLFTGDEPERLRGPQFDLAWLDELAAMNYPARVWDQLMLGLRLGTSPRVLVTTTPRPIKTLRELLAREGHDVVVTRGKTRDNIANLAPGFVEAIEERYGGTRLGRQELDGELLEDVPGALWQRDWIDRDRVQTAPDLKRIVVAIDPAVSNTPGSDETGIVVAGIAADDHVYVLADLSGHYGPLDWAKKAVAAYRDLKADRIIAEANNGGDLVEATLRTAEPGIPFKKVHASRGKVIRAEPVSALYERRMVHHVGALPDLEDQQCAFTSDFSRSAAGYSPDRVDALVWAISELAVRGGAAPIYISSYSGQVIYDSRAPIPRAPGTPDWVLRGDRYPPGDPRWAAYLRERDVKP